MQAFGGESTPATGVAHGLDRIVIAMQMQKVPSIASVKNKVAVFPVRETMIAEALRIAQMLREAGISAELEIMGRNINKALEDADRRQMDFAVIIGEKELKQGCVVLRNLIGREQTTVGIKELAKILKAQDQTKK
ncbi:TPA: hypothetical protein HA273_05630 [Candidatus Bathyarchaeota archaeon]|nr:hypothetical protein [Candidatus Bathyarchaeota archaeon]